MAKMHEYHRTGDKGVFQIMMEQAKAKMEEGKENYKIEGAFTHIYDVEDEIPPDLFKTFEKITEENNKTDKESEEK